MLPINKSFGLFLLYTFVSRAIASSPCKTMPANEEEAYFKQLTLVDLFETPHVFYNSKTITQCGGMRYLDLEYIEPNGRDFVWISTMGNLKRINYKSA